MSSATRKEAELFLAKITTAEAKPSSYTSIDTAWRVLVEPKWGGRSIAMHIGQATANSDRFGLTA